MSDYDLSPNIPLAAEFLTVKQLAERIRIAPHTIHGWIRRGKLGSKQGLRRSEGARRWLIHWKTFKEHFVVETRSANRISLGTVFLHPECLLAAVRLVTLARATDR
jgi:Helix-turn-helix domain